MDTQGTLDVFTSNFVSADAAAVTGRIDRIFWPSGSQPPQLGFIQPDLPTDEQASLPLTLLLGEDVRVEIDTRQYCTECGTHAGQRVCRDCAGTPPLASCVTQPATRCQYADCPFPDYKENSCSHEFVVYLVAADGLKVGITKRSRTMPRWQEQGATHALPIATAPNRKAAGVIERAITELDHVDQRLSYDWYEPMEQALEALVAAANDAQTAFPDRLMNCYRWGMAPPKHIQDSVVAIPSLETDELNHRRVSQNGVLQPGNAREAEVRGVRGPLIATDEYIINTKAHAGHGITIEADAPFLTSHDATAPTDTPPLEAHGTHSRTQSADANTDTDAASSADTTDAATTADTPDYPASDFL